MHSEITHITRLIDDLLDTARVETGALKYRKQVCRLEECLALACEIVLPVLENAKQTLSVSAYDTSISLWADPNRIAQVISNLLHNASKFSAPGSTVALRVRIETGEVRIEVSDQGQGILLEEHRSIFERYAKGCEAPESSSSGIGLGLFVSREIARSHGGQLELVASSPLGATFRISLPLYDGHKSSKKPTFSIATKCAPTSILLVDDNTSGLETMKLLLELDGHIVYAATSAREGLLLFERHTPKVAVLDLGLPDLNGRALARRFRGMRTGTNHLLIALTGRGLESDARLSLEAGFDAHLIKPATVEQLSALISDHLATV
jgi:CheY-like chemotaxis protein